MGINRKMDHYGKDGGRASSGPEIFQLRQGCPVSLPWLQGPPTRSQQSRPCWHHATLDPATLAMVLASSLYAESSVEELDWPTCWARKQQKRALKMLRPRGFLGEDLETRPRVEGTTEALTTGRLSTNTHPRAVSPLVYKLHWGTRHVLGEQPNTVNSEMYMFIPTSSL